MRTNTLESLVISLRPKQWIKNFFVIVPLFFSKKLMDFSIVERMIYAFLLFCLFSSSIYLINDIIDLGKDKHHPKKARRPLAQGLLTPGFIFFVSLILFLIASAGSFMLDKNFLFAGLIYWFINILYTVHLKHVPIIDVICIAIGFVLRVIAGGIIVGVPSSPWILTTTVFLSLFLGFAKRRGEIVLLRPHIQQSTREVLKEYNVQLLNQFLVICATASIMSYTLFTLSDYTFQRFGTHDLIYTTPFVIFGIFRYFYLIHFSDFYKSPTETLLTDKPLIFDVLLWVLCVVICTNIIVK